MTSPFSMGVPSMTVGP